MKEKPSETTSNTTWCGFPLHCSRHAQDPSGHVRVPLCAMRPLSRPSSGRRQPLAARLANLPRLHKSERLPVHPRERRDYMLAVQVHEEELRRMLDATAAKRLPALEASTLLHALERAHCFPLCEKW